MGVGAGSLDLRVRAESTWAYDSGVWRLDAPAVAMREVMRPEYVLAWWTERGIEALDGERPINLIARGAIARVARVSEFEETGASC